MREKSGSQGITRLICAARVEWLHIGVEAGDNLDDGKTLLNSIGG